MSSLRRLLGHALLAPLLAGALRAAELPPGLEPVSLLCAALGTDAGASALAAHPELASLRGLDLSLATDRAAAALLAPRLPPALSSRLVSGPDGLKSVLTELASAWPEPERAAFIALRAPAERPEAARRAIEPVARAWTSAEDEGPGMDVSAWPVAAPGTEGGAASTGLESAALAPELIHRVVSGPSGVEAIVLIHGVDDDARTWAAVVERLGRTRRVIAYDQRGHGRTPPAGADYSPGLLARDLAGLLDHMGVERAHLLGHSVGARVALAFAALFPGRALSVISEDMDALPRRTEKAGRYLALAERLASMPRRFASRAEALRALKPVFGREAAALASLRTRPASGGGVELAFDPAVSVLVRYLGASADLSAALRAFPGPLLFLRAETAASALSEAGAARILSLRPDARLVAIPGASHAIHASSLDAFLAAVESFLDGLRRP